MKEIQPWQILKSTISHKDLWLHIRSDTCQTPSGHIIEPYHVLECSTWVNVLALTPTGQVVLVREYRHGAAQVLLGLPGGAAEEWDDNPHAAIQRELLEETGYGGGEFFEIGQSYANPSNQNNIVWSFLAINVLPTQQQHLDESEQIEIVLQDVNSFSQQAWSGELPMQALHLTTLGFATHFIRQNKLPQLDAIRIKLLQMYLPGA